MDFYVYLHRKASNGEVFYVGKGCGRRAWSRNGRSDWWKHIVAKHGLMVDVVIDGLQEWYAFEYEAELISLYGRKSDGYGCLINLSDGGEGASGVVRTIETRRKMSNARQGIVFTKQHVANLSAARKGIKLSVFTRSKMSKARKGVPQHEQWRHNRTKSLRQKFGKAVVRSDGIVYDTIIDAAKSVWYDGQNLNSIATAIGEHVSGKRKSLVCGYSWSKKQGSLPPV